MSLLTKIFIILVFVVSLVVLAVQTVLYSQKVDWKAKWEQEVAYHAQTINLKDSEIAYLKMEIENRKDLIKALQEKINILVHENAIHVTRVADLERRYTEKIYEKEKLKADLKAFNQNLEAQLQRIKAQANKVAELRQRVAKLVTEKNVAVQEAQYLKEELERVEKDLGNLEKRHIEAVREKRRLQDQLEELDRMGFDISFGPPQKPVDGKVMSYSPSARVAIINRGRDDGVILGMKFTVYRGDRFVGSATVKEAQREWSAIEIHLKHLEPQVGDDVSNHILMNAVQPQPGK